MLLVGCQEHLWRLEQVRYPSYVPSPTIGDAGLSEGAGLAEMEYAALRPIRPLDAGAKALGCDPSRRRGDGQRRCSADERDHWSATVLGIPGLHAGDWTGDAISRGDLQGVAPLEEVMGFLRAFALMVMTLVACSRPSGDLSGHVFLLMQSGDVKRAGGIEVLIVSATEGFMQEWNGIVKAYVEERKRLDAERKTAEGAEAKTKAEYDEAFQTGLKAMHYPGEEPLTLPGRKLPERAREKREQPTKKSDQAREKWTEATMRKMRALRNPLDLQRDYSLRAWSLITKQPARRVQADVNGRYEAKGLPTGKAYLAAKYEVFATVHHWFVPVEVKPGAQTLDLSNANLSWPFNG